MTPCSVLKCPNAANEAVEPLLIVGPLCDGHRARVLAGEEYELQGSEESATGTAQPTVLMGDSLRSLDQYALLAPPNQIVSGNSPGRLVPLRVQRRGEPNERDLNLVIPPDMLPGVAEFFQAVVSPPGRFTPPMDSAMRRNYLDNDLKNEIRYLLAAATEWHTQAKLHLGIGGYEVQVYAMDSTFLHARALFEFFTRKTTAFFYGYNEFGLESKIKSSLYENHWSDPLHARLMHLQSRSRSADVKRFDPDDSQKEHIKNMPVDFAKEVVRMWHVFAGALQALEGDQSRALGQRAHEILREALDAAEAVRTNAVTESQVAQRRKEDPDFVIDPIEWPV